MNLHEDAKMKIERKEEQELEILGEILEAYVDTPIKKDAFLIGDLGLDSFLIVYFISEVDERIRRCDRDGLEHVEYMTVQDVLDQLNGESDRPKRREAAAEYRKAARTAEPEDRRKYIWKKHWKRKKNLLRR